MSDQQHIIQDALRGFRRKEIEPRWDKLDRPDPGPFSLLWSALDELGVTRFTLPETLTGMTLETTDQYLVIHELGRACPALGTALIGHLVALALVQATPAQAHTDSVNEGLLTGRFSFPGSPLDACPDTPFVLRQGKTGLQLDGRRRCFLSGGDWLLIPARAEAQTCMVILPASSEGISFERSASSHGLKLLPFGTLTMEKVAVTQAQMHPWPDDGRAAQLADGLVTALLGGMIEEMAVCAANYAVERYQGGRMIHEHHAVQQLIGPMLLARWPLQALACAALQAERPGDASGSCMAIDIARQGALDAIQTLGGYGYMEDFRLERYLRDANTLENLWIHQGARQRARASHHCQTPGQQEVAA